MRIRLLAPAAAGAILLGAVAGPAVAVGAAPAPRPAAGTATSALTLLSLALAGHDVRVGSVALTSDTASGHPTASVVVTPVLADGTPYGARTVTPANSPGTVPSFDSAATLPAALGAVASVKSPVFTVSSSNASGASSKAAATSLGSASVLGLPVKLDGTLDVSSLVNGANSVGTKTLTVKNLALPSVADILGALGLNLRALPVATLTSLLSGLNLTTPAVTAAQAALATAQAALSAQINGAQAAVDAAKAQLSSAQQQLADKTAQLPPAQTKLTAANAAVAPAQTAVITASAAVTAAQTNLNAAQAAVQAAAGVIPLATFVSNNSTVPVVQTYVAAQDALTAANATAATAATNLSNAQTAAAAAAAAVTAVNAAITTAQQLVTSLTATLSSLLNTLNGLLGQLAPQTSTLLAAVTAVLSTTPLVSIDSFTVQTQALAKSASSGGQTAKVVGGELQGVHVLGTDVLRNVLGTSSVKLLDLTGSTLSSITSKLGALTGVLSSVLSAVPGLRVPAPTVGLLTKSTSTGVSNGFGVASNSVRALQVTLPAITIPAALALPGAAALPAVTGVPNLTGALPAAGGAPLAAVTSKAVTLGLGTLTEQASFRPAVAAPVRPTVNPAAAPQLPRTGLPVGVAALALGLMGGALLLRRRVAGEQ